MPCARSSSPRRRAAGLLLAGLVAAAGCERATPPAEIEARLRATEPLNVVLILVDTLRADWTSPYGVAEDTSPELARWAERGVVFERTLSQSSWTKMSMASLMTSLWPQSHGIRAYGDGLGEGAVTLAEVLRDAGYATFGVQTNGWLHQTFGFHQGFDRYVFPTGQGARRLPQATVWPHTDRVVEETKRLLDARPTDRPFFLYLHFMDVHEYAAPSEFKQFGSDGRGAYLAAIRWVDDGLTRVREALDDAGVLENTLVVFGSDHGEAFGENGQHGHAKNVLTTVVWVPLVIRPPFPIAPIRVPSQVRNIDIAPTILEAVGAPVPEGFEGSSLWPLVVEAGQGRPTADRESFAALGLPLFREAAIQHALNTGDWTFARNLEPGPRPGELMYDRSVDPGENVNLIEREPARAEPLRARMDAYLAGERVEGVLESDVRIDPAIADKLRALGYMQ